jgi:structural maintenance of chromosome 1
VHGHHFRQRKQALESELGGVKDQLAEAKSERRARESDVKLHETVDTLKGLFSGVLGVMSELSAVLNPKYSMALSVAFGRHLDSLVVDTQRTAMECIAYLKESRLHSLTFIPLDTIKAKPLSESMRALKDKGFPLAIECVQFDDDLHRAFLYALSDTLICDTEKVRKNKPVCAPRCDGCLAGDFCCSRSFHESAASCYIVCRR